MKVFVVSLVLVLCLSSIYAQNFLRIDAADEVYAGYMTDPSVVLGPTDIASNVSRNVLHPGGIGICALKNGATFDCFVVAVNVGSNVQAAIFSSGSNASASNEAAFVFSSNQLSNAFYARQSFTPSADQLTVMRAGQWSVGIFLASGGGSNSSNATGPLGNAVIQGKLSRDFDYAGTASDGQNAGAMISNVDHIHSVLQTFIVHTIGSASNASSLAGSVVLYWGQASAPGNGTGNSTFGANNFAAFPTQFAASMHMNCLSHIMTETWPIPSLLQALFIPGGDSSELNTWVRVNGLRAGAGGTAAEESLNMRVHQLFQPQLSIPSGGLPTVRRLLNSVATALKWPW